MIINGRGGIGIIAMQIVIIYSIQKLCHVQVLALNNSFMSARGNEQPETSTLPTLINTLPWKARESPALPSVTKLTLIKGACIFQRGETSNTTQKKNRTETWYSQLKKLFFLTRN